MSSGELESTSKAADAATADGSATLLDSILGSAPKTLERDEAESYIRTLTRQAMEGTVVYDRTVMRTIDNAIAKLDEKLSAQLSEIMHQPAFQKLEGSWRGLHYLVFNTMTSPRLKIRLLNASRQEVADDLENAVAFDQSQLFKKIYENEFGMPGGQPYSTLIGDFEFTNHPEDIGFLEKISGVCASAHCPFISAASPELFGFESWEGLSRPRSLDSIFEEKRYIRWNSFRDSEDSRYVTLTMPRVLARLPYGKNTRRVKAFGYEELPLNDQGGHNQVPHDHYTWMNAAYVYGTRLTAAFRRTGWCTAIRGRENGGTVENLPCHIFKSDRGDEELKCPTEVAITDRREKELSDLGFLPLCHYKNTDYSVFFGAQTCQRPKVYDVPDATANAAISARLPYILASSRIAHYLKCIARDWIGRFTNAQMMEKDLRRWLNRYTTDDPDPSQETMAKFPLRASDVRVEEIPGQPGSYNAVAWLQPFLQLESLNTSLRLVAKLPEKK
jgi:type VI secretion system protein ImpC